MSIQWCHPTISSSVVPFSSCLQSFPASGSFPESVLCIRWPEYWSFSLSISPSSEYSGLISFRMDWLDLLAVQVTQESSPIPQFKSINSAPSFIIQLSYPYMTIGKTIALTRWTFVGPPPLLYLLQTPILMQSSWATYYMARSFAIQLCVGGWSRLFLNEGKFFPEKLCSLLMRFF